MMIWACPYSKLDNTLARSGARQLVALASDEASFTRPEEIAPDNFLISIMNDITKPQQGLILPTLAHVETLLAFQHKQPTTAPIVLTCYAGISRSTAAAYILACASDTNLDEQALAARLRELAPSATPNIRLVHLADQLLGRNGRMRKAIEEIGRGEDAFEGEPFVLTPSVASTYN